MHSHLAPSSIRYHVECPATVVWTTRSITPSPAYPRDFPLFKVTLEEAYLLTQARKILKRGARWTLCGALNGVEGNKRGLLAKIEKSLCNYAFLHGYLDTYGMKDASLRIKWIDKLLHWNQYK